MALLLVLATTGVGPAAGTDRHHGAAPDRASAVLRQAVRAIGGHDALAGLDRFQVTASGATSIGYEANRPDELADTSTYDQVTTVDLSGDRLRVDTERSLLFEALRFFPPQAFSRVVDGRVGGITEGAGAFVPAGTLPSASVAALRRQQVLFNPHLVLRRALDHPDLVSYGGTARLGARPHRILVVADDVADIRLYVDARTGRLSKLVTTESHPLVRDTTVEVRYRDWRPATIPDHGSRRGHGRDRRALRFPTEIELRADGAVVTETRSSVVLAPSLPDDHFALPAGTDPGSFDLEGFTFGRQSHHLVEGFFSLGIPYGQRPGLGDPVELASGVHFLPTTHNSLAIVHDGGVVVVESPVSPTHGDEVVAAVGQLAPGAPITHVVPSHHHVDHAAGVRSMAAVGATVVSGNGVGRFWHEVLAAESAVRPDALAQSGGGGDVLEVDRDGAAVLVDEGDLTVTVYDARVPHADDNVLVTVETGGQLYLYEADIYNAGFGATLVIDGPLSLFDALRDLGLIDSNCQSAVPLTIVPGHGIPLSLADALAELSTLGVDVGC